MKIKLTESQLKRLLNESDTTEVWHKNLEYKKPNMLHKVTGKPFTGWSIRYWDETKKTYSGKDKTGAVTKYELSDKEVKNNPVYSKKYFNNGKQNGQSLGFAKNGNIVSDGEFKNGKAVGRHKFYTENGKLYAYRDYDTNGVGGEVVKVKDNEETVK